MKKLNRQRFGEFAKEYVSSRTHAQGEDLDGLLAIAEPQPEWIGLDVATGGGHTALKFAPHLKRVVVTDLTPPMLAAARAHLEKRGTSNAWFCGADAEALPFLGDIFDLVTCRIAPHHFLDCVQFFQEACRVLKPEGLLLVQDHVLPEEKSAAEYIDDFERLRDPSHHQAFSQRAWVSLAGAAGFEVEHVSQAAKRHDLISWVNRQKCSTAVIRELEKRLCDAPEAVTRWLDPQNLGTQEASFVNRHIILAGRKHSS